MLKTTSRSSITWQDIERAGHRLDNVAFRTWVLRSRVFDEIASCKVFFKTENMQRTGSSKFRGAYNKVKLETERGTVESVVTFSSGNHGQAVALSARLLGLPAVVVMPEDAVASKIEATRGYGAGIVFYDPRKEDWEEIAAELSIRKGAVLVPPYEDSSLAAGEATAAVEFLHDVPDLDMLLVPIRAGGLLRGTALAIRHLNPGIKIYGVEPNSDRLHDNEYPDIDGILRVSDEQIVDTQLFLMERMKIIVEPSGVLGAAAVRFRKKDFSDQKVGVILSDGNVDFHKLNMYLTKEYAGRSVIHSKLNYLVSCFHCGEQFDALDTIWCNCLATERTLTCPRCMECFCRADQKYKTEFWDSAPQILWDKKLEEHSRNFVLKPNPALWELKRPAVLVVDDDKEVQRVAIRVIEELGYGILVATNGEEGLRIARDYLPNLVLTDALVPKLDGREMCLRLKEDPKTSKMKVIVTTGLYTQSKYKAQAFRQFRVDGYLNKPITFNELRILLQKFLG